MKHYTFLLSRLTNQKLASSDFERPTDLVSWMGAMQAQDFQMSLWAVGLRTKNSTESNIKKAIDDGIFIRTHILRPTWHLVSSRDIHWMLELTAPNIIKTMKSRHNELGINRGVLKKSNRILERLLTKEEYVSREDIASEMRKNNIQTGDNRLAHLLFSAELDGLICSGRIKNNRQTYSLLDRRVQRGKIISREEALAQLAGKYFQSHSPASLKDFIWWSGLNVKDAKAAVNSIIDKLTSYKFNDSEYYYASAGATRKKIPKAFLLPAYDEYILSYKDRNILFNSDNHKKVISSNGIFRPVVLVDGLAAGIWKRSLIGNTVLIEISLFNKADKRIKNNIERAAEKYGEYLNRIVNLIYVN